MSTGPYTQCDQCGEVAYASKPERWLRVDLTRHSYSAPFSKVSDLCGWDCLIRFAAREGGLRAVTKFMEDRS